MRAGRLGRHLGKSAISDRLLLPASLVDPFPHESPLSTFDGNSGQTKLPDLGNFQYGNCVFVSYVYARMLKAWWRGTQPTGNATDTSVWPTLPQVVTAYFKYQGSPNPTNFLWSQQMGYDRGCDQGQALLWFTENSIGPMGPLDAFAELPTEGQLYQGAMAAFGCVIDDIVVFQEMMNATNAGQIWDQTTGTVVGGHSTVNAYRSPSDGSTWTWTIDQPFTWPNRRATLEQGWVILDADELNSPAGAQLWSDIAALKAEAPSS